jgi:hypothetical protein
MSYKKLLKQYTPEEIAESFVFPVKYTAKQQEQANRDLAAARKNSQAAMTEEVKLELDLFQLRFQLEDYLKGDYDPALNFGHFLERYLKILNKKKKEFAAEIQIHETLLSHLISNRREPNESIIIRLELHSNKVIPAIYWYKLAEKGKEYHIRTDNSLREKESPFVTQRLQLTY